MAIGAIEVEDGVVILVQISEAAKAEELVGNITGLLPEGTEEVGAGGVAKASELLSQQIEGLAVLGRRIRESATPDELELEAQILFAGSTGIPVLASAGAEAGLKIALKWNNGRSSSE